MSPGLRSNQLAGMLVTSLVVFLCAEFVSSNSPIDDSTWYALYFGKGCTVDGVHHTHGTVFNSTPSHCIKYRCMHGFTQLYETGCELEGRCLRMFSIYDDNTCTRYRCTSNSVNGHMVYQILVIRRLCQDDNGTCWEPGSYYIRHFFTLGQQCTCTARDDGSMSYSCITPPRNTGRSIWLL
ncbi:hypothetical protein BsWGS_03434 [Bradybaena similaris]